MAQRTGAERFLAAPAKGASAGVALALALAAFLLCGCGGGSSAAEDTGASTSASASADANAPGQAAPGQSAEATTPKGGSAPGGSSSSSGSASGGSQEPDAKQGPRIAAPKGPREQAPTPAEIAEATVADMSLESPVLAASAEGPATLPATYTCDGKGSWPELRWSGVPAGSAELILYAMNVAPVEGKLFVDWAVAGLDPALAGIEAGQLPKGAIVGTNSYGKRGYEICPEGSEIFIFAVYALPRALSPQKGFDARELRKQILDVSGNVGLLPAAYAR